MSFKDPKKIWNTIEALKEADRPRAINRGRINTLFNGEQPYTDQEARDNNIDTNVNDLMGTQLIQRARAQYANAFLKPENFFTIVHDIGQRDQRRKSGKIMTRRMNRCMKRTATYLHCLESQFAGTGLHGVGPVTWFRDRHWCPKPRGVEDVLVPSNTTCDLQNLDYFAVYQTFTAAQLIEATHGDNVDKGWNMAMVNKAVAWMAKDTTTSGDSDSFEWIEKSIEDFKSNSGYWGSDAVPVLKCFEFYYLDYEAGARSKREPVWRRKIMVDRQSGQLALADEDSALIYDGSRKTFGTEISQLLHVQFGDGSVVPPFRWHSVRSLGFQLYAVCHLENRMHCRFSDAVAQSLMWLFRNSTTGDEELMRKIDLHHMAVIPDGLRWVLPQERHEVNYELVAGYMTMLRQKTQEHAASYVRDSDQNRQSGDETATAVMARVNTSNQLIGSMLARSYTYQTYQYREIARRFATSRHKDCVKFRNDCVQEGVDPEVFKYSYDWDIIPERVLGGGNKLLEVAQADRLMAARSAYDPDAQRQILHIYTEANTDDPLLASELVPLEGKVPSTGEQMATLAWGTLIDGKPVIVAEGISRIDYVETMLQLLTSDIQRINQEGGMANMQRIQGLANVIQHATEMIEELSVDESNSERTKIWMDIIAKSGNEVKAMLQRLQEEMEAAQVNQMDPETEAKIRGQIAMAEAKLQTHLATAQQKLAIAEAKFSGDQQRKNVSLAGDQARKDAATQAEMARQGVTVQTEVASKAVRTAADIEALDAKTTASVQATRKKAAAKPSKPTKAS